MGIGPVGLAIGRADHRDQGAEASGRAELAGGEFVVGFRRAAPGQDKLGRNGEQPGLFEGVAELENRVHHLVLAAELSFS